MIYSHSEILYEIISNASRPTHSVKKPKPGPHADSVVGSVKSPTVESLAKQLHEFFCQTIYGGGSKGFPLTLECKCFCTILPKGKSAARWEKEKGEER